MYKSTDPAGENLAQRPRSPRLEAESVEGKLCRLRIHGADRNGCFGKRRSEFERTLMGRDIEPVSLDYEVGTKVVDPPPEDLDLVQAHGGTARQMSGHVFNLEGVMIEEDDLRRGHIG